MAVFGLRCGRVVPQEAMLLAAATIQACKIVNL
jgi:hypothetical protein